MRKKRIVLIVFSVIIFLIAAGMILYPLFSNWYIERHAAEIRTEYSNEVENTEKEKLSQMIKDAQAYNQAILPGAKFDAFDDDALTNALDRGYADLLNLTGEGLMGYLRIPTIDVNLPIYHGTTEEKLQVGIGHMLGSSLPVGGDGTHCVLTGHSGMSSQKMLSDLDQVKYGDVFYLNVCGETFAYQVDQILTVLPYETDALQSIPGEDHCTLITCTPFGVNTHRLLVRGNRIPYEEAEQITPEDGESTGVSTWTQMYIYYILIGFVLFILIIVITLIIRKILDNKKKAKKIAKVRDIDEEKA